MPAPAAVLWDMDGTLVDTEPYWIACEHALVDEYGGTWTDADALTHRRRRGALRQVVLPCGPLTELAAELCDMDGTLVDTEPYWIECEKRLVEDFGGTWSDEQAAALIGSDLLDSAATLRAAGVDMEPVDLVNRLLDGVIERVHQELPWRPGARELLQACREAAIPCLLVTMSWRRFADAVLLSAPEGSFVATITGDEVSHGKPHPEPYLSAARALGVDPSTCVAIEDSRTGVASAVAAGCATLGVPHVVTLDPLPNLTIAPTLVGVTVDDLRALLAD